MSDQTSPENASGSKWKNLASKVTRFIPRRPTDIVVAPSTEIIQVEEEPEQPVEEVQANDLFAPTEAEKAEAEKRERLDREAKQVIDSLDAKNRELLKSGHNRLGWHVGLHENEVFILAQPSAREEEAKLIGGQTIKAPAHYYIMYTRDGIRAIRFDKHMMGDQSVDDGYEMGERSLIHSLTEGHGYWEDEEGGLKRYVREVEKNGIPFYPISVNDPPEKREEYQRRYGGYNLYKQDYPGFIKEDGVETFYISGRPTGTRYSARSNQDGIIRLVSEVSNEIVADALERSLKSAQETRNDKKESLIDKQLAGLDTTLSMLNLATVS